MFEVDPVGPGHHLDGITAGSAAGGRQMAAGTSWCLLCRNWCAAAYTACGTPTPGLWWCRGLFIVYNSQTNVSTINRRDNTGIACKPSSFAAMLERCTARMCNGIEQMRELL
jgi:hypothetical protein